MGIGSESAGALKGSVPYQSPAVLVKLNYAAMRTEEYLRSVP